MSKKPYFEFDEKKNVLIRISANESPKIIEKTNLTWRCLGPQDDRYARAIYLGQGCWEDLTAVTEEEGLRLLKEWGYKNI